MVWKWLEQLFGTKAQRDVKKLEIVVGQINEIEAIYQKLSDEELRGKTQEFKQRLEQGEMVEDLLPEAFAAVKNTCRRLLGRSWPVRGIEQTWEMLPYDVQLIGGVVLHNGGISEMATGEGKTLVATMPIYLNALVGKGVHLITVNDYLAQRDAEWMGEIYKFLGLTVGVIITDMDPDDRRISYHCDVTYGTNNEFGFDYLRDNMAVQKEGVVQRDHFYAIVDEVDSVLIDEARTPLIISGPVPQSTHKYYELRPMVERLVKKQTVLANSMVSQAKHILDDEHADSDKTYQAGILLLQAQRGYPKNKQLMKLLKEPEFKKLLTRVENDYMRDKKMNQIDEALYYIIDEKSNASDLMEKGREDLSPDDPDYFVLPPLNEQLSEIEGNEGIDQVEKLKMKDKLIKKFGEKSERLHNISNLLRAYSLFEKDVEYVVQDNKVVIVDEFTGRLMPGRRYSDGMHQAIEAKEGTRIEQETQTFATITLQNYFRMYKKLAGMTGTAVTEESEFWEIYKLGVITIPTNKPIRRMDYDDAIFRSKKEKYEAIIQEITRLHQNKQPILVGTVSVEVSETLSRLLKRRNLPHNVLNAKYHQKEAEIVSQAGQPGAITIATNMAGRGTDIKLGKGVVQCDGCFIRNPAKHKENPAFDVKKCEKNVPCGLHIIGTERHESRRIDRQLRGRSGRQGDPGSTRFFVSLEDDLMRLFGSERYANVLSRLKMEEDERIEHPWITRSIERAQKMVENRNFEIRKHLLEYDNVMNQQRSIVYKKRREILFGDNFDPLVTEMIENVIWDKVGKYTDKDKFADEWELDALQTDLQNIFKIPITINLEDFDKITQEILAEYLIPKAKEVYALYLQIIPPDQLHDIERMMFLHSFDFLWREHLYALDGLRDSVGLRAYGQKDPIIEYKRESFELFQELQEKMDELCISNFFRLEVKVENRPQQVEYQHKQMQHLDGARVVQSAGEKSPPEIMSEAKGQTLRRIQPKIGPNEPCPCGSGKKYKKCCGSVSADSHS